MSIPDDIDSYVAGLKVAELKEELKKLNLSPQGNKATLGQRLREALQEKKRGEQAEETREETTEESEAATEEEEATEQTATAELEEEKGGEAENEEEEEAAEQEGNDEEEAGNVEAAEEENEEQALPASEDAAQQASEEAVSSEMDGNQEEKTTTNDEQTTEQEQQETEEGDEVVDEVGGESTEEEKTTKDDAMETNTTESGEKDDRKRQREDDDRRKDTSRDRRERPDPTKAPDPEDPSDDFNEEITSQLVETDDKFQPPDDDATITLDNFNADLYFKISPDGVTGHGLTQQGFAYLWAAAKATWGAKGGKVCFEVKILEYMTVLDLAETEEHPNALRVGWSTEASGLDLGETPLSYGYGCTGKAVVNNQYNEYGEPYGDGDVITCLLDLESSPPSISFARNGNHLGIAFTLDEAKVKGQCFFPHISVKNVQVRMNFCEPLYRPLPEGFEEYIPLQSATPENKQRATAGPKDISECEVLLMVGLPASGKTTWAKKHMRENPSKRYTILGTNQIMDKMKVSGLNRRGNYHQRWEVLIKKATDILNRLLVIAGKIPRNYIIDQTNVYAKAQYRKMGYFVGFMRKAVVVIPPHHELRKRVAMRNKDMGDPVPEDALNAMKANFHVPMKDTIFEEVIFTEIYGQAANKIVQQYKDDAMGLPSFPQSKRGRYDRYDRGHHGNPHHGRFGSPRGYGSPGGGYRGSYGGGGGGGSPYGRGGGGGGGYPSPHHAGGFGGYRPMYPPYGGNPMYNSPPPPRRGNFGYGPPPGPYGGGGRSPYGYGPPHPPPSRGYYGRY